MPPALAERPVPRRQRGRLEGVLHRRRIGRADQHHLRQRHQPIRVRRLPPAATDLCGQRCESGREREQRRRLVRLLRRQREPGERPTRGAQPVRGNGGTPKFIATLNPSDSCDWSGCLTPGCPPTASSSCSTRPTRLTGFNNTDASTGSPDDEIFLYDAAAGTVVCASCSPAALRSGARSSTAPQSDGVEATSFFLNRYVSDSGQVFFDTPDALLPTDTDGAKDVYEYEAGQLSLISSGTDCSRARVLRRQHRRREQRVLRHLRAARPAGHRRRGLRHLRRAGRRRVPVLRAGAPVPGREPASRRRRTRPRCPRRRASRSPAPGTQRPLRRRRSARSGCSSGRSRAPRSGCA